MSFVQKDSVLQWIQNQDNTIHLPDQLIQSKHVRRMKTQVDLMYITKQDVVYRVNYVLGNIDTCTIDNRSDVQVVPYEMVPHMTSDLLHCITVLTPVGGNYMVCTLFHDCVIMDYRDTQMCMNVNKNQKITFKSPDFDYEVPEPDFFSIPEEERFQLIVAVDSTDNIDSAIKISQYVPEVLKLYDNLKVF